MTLTFKLYTFSVDKLKGDDEDTKLIVYSNGTVVWDQSVISKVSFLSCGNIVIYKLILNF